MAQILVRDLDDKIVDRLKTRAADHRRSLQAEVKLILEQAARLDRAEARRVADEIRNQLKGRRMSDSADLIRESRDR
jgi:plasmid stability protein